MLGAVLHTLNLRLHRDELAYIARHAEDRVVLVDGSLLPLLEASASGRLPARRRPGTAARTFRHARLRDAARIGTDQPPDLPEPDEHTADAMC